MLTLVIFAGVGAIGYYLYKAAQPGAEQEKPQPPALSDEQIKERWRALGFFCERDDERREWRLTGSRAGLLYFPDLLLGYVNDPANETNGESKHYGPYGSLEIMTWTEAGIDAHAIRGSLMHLTHLAELVESKLALAEPGTPIPIREEYAPEARYKLVLDVRADGFDPASADREQLGVTASPKKSADPA